MRFVFCTAAVCIVPGETYRDYRSPPVRFCLHDKWMIFLVARQSASAAEDQERAIGRNLRVDVEGCAIAE